MPQENFILTLFTNDPILAAIADSAGVDRIGPDLETIGKVARQGHLDTRISAHSIADFSRVRAVLKNAAPFARVNPINENSHHEINALIELGANVLMLPMFSTVTEVETFVHIISSRARVVLLVETPAAVLRFRQLIRVDGVDEVHFGLNDLCISFGAINQYEVASSELLRSLCAIANEEHIPFSIGGIAAVGDCGLPVPSELFYQKCVALGAQGALISRSFFRNVADFPTEIRRARQFLQTLQDVQINDG
jgi:hypothetical protein